MDYLTGVLCRSTSRTIRIQLIQTMSMLIHNIGKKKTLCESNDVLCFIEELMDLEIELINQRILYLMFVICFIPLIRRLVNVDVNMEKLTVDIGSSPNYSDLYNKLSNSIGLSFFYINNKTLLFNTNSADTTPNVNIQNQSSPKTNTKPPTNSVNDSESKVPEENKTEKSEKNNLLSDYEHNNFDLPNDFDLDRGGDVTINEVIYNILVTVIINSKRKEFVNPLTALLFSPVIPQNLLYIITSSSSDKTSKSATNNTNSPQVSSAVTTPRNYNPVDETFEYKNYKIDEENVEIFHMLLSFNEFLSNLNTLKNDSNGGNDDGDKCEKGEFESDNPSVNLEDSSHKHCPDDSSKTVLNVIMGLFIYDGLKSLKYNNDNNKMMNLLKLLIHLQNKVFIYKKSSTEQCNLMVILKSMFNNNEIYLQLFNVISINMTNFNFNILVLKLYNFFLQNYINFNTKNENDPNLVDSKVRNSSELENNVEDKGEPNGKEVDQGVDLEPIKPDSSVVDNSKIIKMDALIDEIKFHLDIVYNIIRIYILNSVESTTTLLYLSIFYVEWIKYIKLYYSTLNLTVNDIMFIDENDTNEQEVTNTNHEVVINYSPINIFKRYIMVMNSGIIFILDDIDT
eukprot:XP_765215.1 hypothetical protein [Theileria parva strain Muguga]